MKHKPVSTHEDMTKAHVDLGRKLDARLCAKGFTEVMDQDVGAPTVNVATLRACLSLIPVKGWHFESIDISRAYLQSNNLERPVYIIPPTTVEADQSVVWKALEPVY